jgi:CRP-like cAMP-binding protein
MPPADSSAGPGPPDPRANRLLSLLPEEDYERLLPHMETVPLKLRDIFYNPREPIRHVYFPLTCVGSLVNLLEGGDSVEFGTVGYEGMIGLPVLLQTRSVPTQAICQVAGEAVRVSAEVFQTEMDRAGPVQRLLLRYTQYLFNQMAQTAACNRFHPIEERCSRWLLMTRDRVGRDEFTLTQEFLATMLGVRRATVTVAAGILQEAGLIRYRRGRVKIVDPESLEESSCECYRIIRDEYEALLGPQ